MINCIVAVDQKQGIGLNGQMPWPYLKGDMDWFRMMTTNQVVVMGATTWKSLGCKPLPNRINIVLSKSHDYSGNNAADHSFSDPDAALSFCKNEYLDKEIFIIGGDAVYKLFMPVIDKFFVTEIDVEYNCDRHFNLSHVKKMYTSVKEHASYTYPVNYTIKEYNI